MVSALGAGVAYADETITARPPNEFAAPVTTIDQGEKVTLRNMDIVSHDVSSQKKIILRCANDPRNRAGGSGVAVETCAGTGSQRAAAAGVGGTRWTVGTSHEARSTQLEGLAVRRFSHGGFDPGSGRTLAARLIHASRAIGGWVLAPGLTERRTGE